MLHYDASVKSHSAFLLAMNNATCSRIAERPYDTPKHEEVAICVANQRIPSVYRIAQASEGSEAIRSIIATFDTTSHYDIDVKSSIRVIMLYNNVRRAIRSFDILKG